LAAPIAISHPAADTTSAAAASAAPACSRTRRSYSSRAAPRHVSGSPRPVISAERPLRCSAASPIEIAASNSANTGPARPAVAVSVSTTASKSGRIRLTSASAAASDCSISAAKARATASSCRR